MDNPNILYDTTDIQYNFDTISDTFAMEASCGKKKRKLAKPPLGEIKRDDCYLPVGKFKSGTLNVY